MYSELVTIISPILICAGLGFAWARKGLEYPVEFVTRAVMYIGAPCLIISSFSKSGIEISKMGEIAAAAVLGVLVMLVIGAVLILTLKLRITTFLPSLLFPNIGNMGLPLCLFAFGESGLALALTVFLVIFSLQMSVGIVLVAGKGNLTGLLKQPVIWATALAVLLVSSGLSLPAWLDNTTSLLGGFTIPLMMLTLGVSLADLKVFEWRHSLLFSTIRVVGGFCLGVMIAALFGLEGEERGVLILQSSMPVAVFNYLLSMRYQREPCEVAAMVLLSYLLAFVLLPFIVAYLLV